MVINDFNTLSEEKSMNLKSQSLKRRKEKEETLQKNMSQLVEAEHENFLKNHHLRPSM